MKILYVTTISLTMNSFFKPHIEMLIQDGNQVDIACNYKDLELDNAYNELGCNSYQIDFSRTPLSLDNVKAYFQLKKVIMDNKYDIVHCHTPNASVITRIVCSKFRKRDGLRVFYTAHGFHFYKGAPKVNWMFFYPVEKICSRFTDKLVTINKEDYILAKNKFNAKKVSYIPGVGIDFTKFTNPYVERTVKRSEIGVPENSFLLLSVGELNKNKNHQIIIQAMAKFNDPNIHYAIAGEGETKNHLLELANDFGISEKIHLLGYRDDIAELNYSADVFCFPSIREGLGLAALEAMVCGLPVVAADNRGTRSFISHGKNGYICRYDSVEEFTTALTDLVEDAALRKKFSVEGIKKVEEYSINNVLMELRKVYSDSLL